MDSTNSWRLGASLDLNINAFNSIDSATPIKAPIKEDKPVDGSQTRVLVEELTRITSENKMLAHKLSVLSESYSVLRNQLADLISNNSDKQINLSTSSSNKRKAESEDYSNDYYILNSRPAQSSSSDELDSANKMADKSIRTCISRVYFRTNPFDACLGVKDGYHWKKYGQKVTRDNPSPRAYFKCSFAPSCPVKKKVQRSAEDPSVLVAIYEGEHNHKQQEPCSDRRQVAISPIASRPSPTSGPGTATLDLMQNGSTVQPNNSEKGSEETDEASATQQILVQKMASSLTRDPNFTAALAAAISGRFNCTRT